MFRCWHVARLQQMLLGLGAGPDGKWTSFAHTLFHFILNRTSVAHYRAIALLLPCAVRFQQSAFVSTSTRDLPVHMQQVGIAAPSSTSASSTMSA